MNLTDRELLAKTLQAEAGNQGLGGMMAVGSVIRNRMGQGGSLRDVILAPAQFSAWNKFTGAAGGEQGQDMAAMKPSEDAYAAADAILSGNAPDVTGGATHYYNPSISDPAWGQKAGGDWAKIGAHIFGKAGDYRTGAASMNGDQMQQAQQPQERQGLLAGLLGGQGLGERLGMSQDFADKLAMAVMAGTGDARLQPLIAQRAAGMKERKDLAKDQAKRNKTAEYLRSIGMGGAAGLVETGLFTGAQALDISKSQEDRDLAEQAAAALQAGDNATAMALLTRLSPTAMGQQLAARTAKPKTEVIGGGKYTVTYDDLGTPTISVNEDVIAAEQKIAQQEKIAQGLPSDARKAEEEDFAAMDTLGNLIQDTAGIAKLFGYNPKTNTFEGKLGIGPLDYIGGKLGSMGIGGAGREDLAKARGEFERFKTRFINNSLRLNKGVQTEGDAQRVANELETASTEATAYAAIQELMKINERAYADRANAINRRRARFGLPAVETPAAPTSPNLQWSIVDG